jgi:polyisoprenoid-binding protein YceI
VTSSRFGIDHHDAILTHVQTAIPSREKIDHLVSHYRIVPERSHVSISGRSTLHPIEATTDGLRGTLDLEMLAAGRLDLQSQPRATVSLPVARLESGNRLEDRELRRRIDARRFPTIDGELLEIQEGGADGRYLVRGNVTFRGVTRSYTREMSFITIDERTLRIEGESIFDVRDFGMEPPRILTLKVEPEVRVRIEIVAETDA